MQILIISDVHGNLSALESVLKEAYLKYTPQMVISLGDLIDYGMRSNEVVEKLKTLNTPFIENIWGNHEHAIMTQDYTHFSSERGVLSAKYTRKNLNEETKSFLLNNMNTSGKSEVIIDGYRCLLVHGSLEDYYWKSIDIEHLSMEYIEYDYVLSGHSHIPYYYEKFYYTNNPDTRNRKKTVFVNPGSVGQPRNLNPKAQFVIWDTTDNAFHFESSSYDIEFEQSLFDYHVDNFYKERLKRGV